MLEMHNNSTSFRRPSSSSKDAGQTPRYMAINPFCAFSGLTRYKLYELLGTGDIRAIKVGKRTLIDVEQALTWLASRPVAQFRKAS
ncbi:hypothetical protein HLH36_19280 [Gluconacetobacter aggeris]|uniref:Excisionase family DNA binding protein n=1 Tax=Gluconacetobacter aggeris TaxID=1286186 RepID=A0A7W4P0A1_9PROT|nr:hypothetical protein [Gluconacetobacter aggeris]MBB2170443.1 hypothetical protein [Gluconacetobacter aggeris]